MTQEYDKYAKTTKITKNLMEDIEVFSNIIDNDISNLTLESLKDLTASIVNISVMGIYLSDNIRGESTEYPADSSANTQIKAHSALFDEMWNKIEKNGDFDIDELLSDIVFSLKNLNDKTGVFSRIKEMSKPESTTDDKVMTLLRKAGVDADYVRSQIEDVTLAHCAAYENKGSLAR